MGPNHQFHLCCCLDNTSPRPASTSTSAAASGCSIPRRRGRPGLALPVSTKRTADLQLQVTLPRKTCSKVTVDFHSQVSRLSTCLQVHCDFHSQVSHLSTCLQVHCDFHHQVSHLSGRAIEVHHQECAIQVHHQERAIQVHGQVRLTSQFTADFIPFGTGLPLWHGSLFVVQSSCSCELDTATLPQTLPRVCTLCFPIFLWLKFLLH